MKHVPGCSPAIRAETGCNCFLVRASAASAIATAMIQRGDMFSDGAFIYPEAIQNAVMIADQILEEVAK